MKEAGLPQGSGAQAPFEDGFWHSADGLRLHYRDHPGPADRPVVLCIPGLTRNARDFEPVAAHLAGRWRVVAIDLRGRGDSDYAKDPATYQPQYYVADVEALLDQVIQAPVVAIGTSLGGIITMLLASRRPAALAGAVLNDIGPQIEPEGLLRIRAHVGQGGTFPTWMHAARALRELNGAAFPDYAISDWLRLAKRLMCVSGNGRITFDYDMKISEPFERAGEPPTSDLWPAFAALAGIPVLALRGELSDILSAETLQRMAAALPGLEAVTIPRTGHPPTLEEPAALAAIDRLLARVESRRP